MLKQIDQDSLIIVNEETCQQIVSDAEAFTAVQDIFAAMARNDAYNFPVIREAIGYAESDADHFIREPIRIRLLECRCVDAVALDNAGRETGPEPMRPQEHQYVLQVSLALDRLVQLRDLLRAQPAHLLQLVGFVFDDPQRVVTELVDDLGGRCRTDALDQARREVGFDAGCARRGDCLERLDLDLWPELGVQVLLADQPKALALGQSGHRANHCNRLASSGFDDLDHGPSAVWIAEREPVDNTFDGYLLARAVLAHGKLGVDPHCHGARIGYGVAPFRPCKEESWHHTPAFLMAPCRR